MKQSQYEAIITCIQFGAPALATGLCEAFNIVVKNSNDYLNKLAQEEEAKRIKEAEKAATKEANLGLQSKNK